jgi:hypothetical protein
MLIHLWQSFAVANAVDPMYRPYLVGLGCAGRQFWSVIAVERKTQKLGEDLQDCQLTVKIERGGRGLTWVKVSTWQQRSVPLAQTGSLEPVVRSISKASIEYRKMILTINAIDAIRIKLVPEERSQL